MKKLLLLLMIVGLVMAASGTASVLAQTTYELYADVKSDYSASDFRLRYIDLDGDGKFSFDELISFSGVGWTSQTYTEILGVPSDTTDSPLTDGPYWDSAHHDWWYFYNPGSGVYVRPNAWTYSQVPVSSKISVSKPGITVVQDQEGDFLLRRCNPDHPNILCSLPPSPEEPPETLPGFFDVKNAKIIQLGPKWVELSIALYAPIPQVPPYPFGLVNYFWQFEGGCVQGSAVDKAGVSVIWTTWDDGKTEWRANWYMIESCGPPRIAIMGASVPFEFTNDGVKVRVKLSDLLTAIDLPPIGPGYLEWHAGARRIPFIFPPYNYTTAVDYAPDVIAFLPCYPPEGAPCYWEPDEPTTWEPR